MKELCGLIWCGLIGFFRSRASLEAEILVLRHLTQAADLRQHRSADICRAVWLSAERPERVGDRQARNRNPLAPRGFSLVLAMEVKIARWSSEAARRH
jgi:hypothetical protein